MALYSRSILLCMLIILGCNSHLDTLYTSSNEDYLVNLIKGAQDKASGLFEKSLSTSYYATEALSVSGIGIPHRDALCASLGSLKFSSWEELYNLLVTRARAQCIDSIKDTTRSKLADGLRGNKLSKVYYAIASISTLSTTKASLFDTASVDLLEVAKHIKSFQLPTHLFTEQVKSSKSRPSIHKTSMALSAVAKLVSLPNLSDAQRSALKSSEMQQVLTSLVDTANALVKDYSAMKEEMVSYSSSLTATSVVLESITEFVTTARDLVEVDFDTFSNGQYLEKLVRYVLSFRTTTSPTSARHVLVLMKMLKSSDLFTSSIPTAVRWTHQVFHDDPAVPESPLTVSISDVFGRAILSQSASVELVSNKKGPKGTMTSTDRIAFTYSFGEAVRALNAGDGVHGFYKLKATVSDETLTEDMVLSASLKVTTSLKAAKFGIQYSKRSDDGFNRVSYPATLDAVYDASPSQKVKLEIQAKGPQKPSQIVIAFVDRDGRTVLTMVPKTRQEKWALTIDLNKNAFRALKEGKYTLDVVIGDALFREAVVWKGIVAIECIEEEDEVEVDYEPINDEIPKWELETEIQHTFAPEEPTPPVIFPMVFCGVVALPLCVFVYWIFVQMGISIQLYEDAKLSSMLFLANLVGVLVILFLYWWQWNIFEAGGWLAMASVSLFFFGYNVLKEHLLTRTRTKAKRE